MNYFAIEQMARDRQRELLDEAAYDRLTREVTRKSNGSVREQRQPRPSHGLGTLYTRIRIRFSAPRPSMTREPAA
jgi:hypothetical protein